MNFIKLALLASLMTVSSLRGDTLAETVINESGSVNSVLNSHTNFSFKIGNVPVTVPSYSNSTTLQFNASEVGQTLLITPSNDSALFSSLVNGQPDKIGIGYLGGGYDKPENQFFSLYPVNWNGIDFQGFNIDSLALTINSITLNSPESDPNHDGQWTDYSYSLTLAVNGTAIPQSVPEPVSGCLAILALISAVAARVYRRRAERLS